MQEVANKLKLTQLESYLNRQEKLIIQLQEKLSRSNKDKNDLLQKLNRTKKIYQLKLKSQEKTQHNQQNQIYDLLQRAQSLQRTNEELSEQNLQLRQQIEILELYKEENIPIINRYNSENEILQKFEENIDIDFSKIQEQEEIQKILQVVLKGYSKEKNSREKLQRELEIQNQFFENKQQKLEQELYQLQTAVYDIKYLMVEHKQLSINYQNIKAENIKLNKKLEETSILKNTFETNFKCLADQIKNTIKENTAIKVFALEENPLKLAGALSRVQYNVQGQNENYQQQITQINWLLNQNNELRVNYLKYMYLVEQIQEKQQFNFKYIFNGKINNYQMFTELTSKHEKFLKDLQIVSDFQENVVLIKREQLLELADQIEQLQEKKNELKNQLLSIQQDIEFQEQKMENQEQKFENLSNKLEQQINENRKLQAEIENNKNALEINQSIINEMTHQLDSEIQLKTTIQNQEVEIFQIQQKLKEQTEIIQKLTHKCIFLEENQLNINQEYVDKLFLKNQNLQIQLKSIQQKLISNKDLSSDIHIIITKCNSIQQMDFSQFTQIYMELLQSKNDLINQLNNKINTREVLGVNNITEVPPQEEQNNINYDVNDNSKKDVIDQKDLEDNMRRQIFEEIKENIQKQFMNYKKNLRFLRYEEIENFLKGNEIKITSNQEIVEQEMLVDIYQEQNIQKLRDFIQKQYRKICSDFPEVIEIVQQCYEQVQSIISPQSQKQNQLLSELELCSEIIQEFQDQFIKSVKIANKNQNPNQKQQNQIQIEIENEIQNELEEEGDLEDDDIEEEDDEELEENLDDDELEDEESQDEYNTDEVVSSDQDHNINSGFNRQQIFNSAFNFNRSSQGQVIYQNKQKKEKQEDEEIIIDDE